MLNKNNQRRLTHHVPLALGGGVVVFVVLYISAWFNLRGEHNVSPKQNYTRWTLGFLKTQLDSYCMEHNDFPGKLSDIPADQSSWSGSGVIVAWSQSPLVGPPLDEWGNLIQYHPGESSYELYSLGRDGQPGGIGLDADLYSDGRNREKALPTFWQFFNSPDVLSGDFFVAGNLAGCVVCCMIFVSLHVPLLSNPDTNLRELIIYTVAIVVISTFVGIALLPLHVPSGH